MAIRKKIGVLGAGQLGRMLSEAASPLDIPLYLMDKSNEFPGALINPNFIAGDFKDFDDVLAFGRKMDVVTIEIESVSLKGLEHLESVGKEVYPNAKALKIIKDKGLQRAFYEEQGIASPNYTLYQNAETIKEAISNGFLQYPFVQKSRTEGYDGRGVSIIKSKDDLSKLLDTDSVVEDLVDIDKEIGVVVARNKSGQVEAFVPVEMAFDPEANLLDMLICPARIAPEKLQECIDIAISTIKAFDIIGLLAVELFIDKAGNISINEVAPRPHNSGHHTIENCIVSQFQQHLRAITNTELIKPSEYSPAVMVNLLGAANHTGAVKYFGLQEVLKTPKVYCHLYGKKETRPFRKMGHVTVLDQNLEEAIRKAQKIKKLIKITS